MSFTKVELDVLRKAMANPRAYSPESHQELVAVDRLYNGGFVDSGSKPRMHYGSRLPHYAALYITEAGREALAEVEGDKGGGVERQVYVEVIFVLIDNPAVQQSPEDAERLKAAVQVAPMDKLREVIGWLGTAVTMSDFGIRLIKAFLA